MQKVYINSLGSISSQKTYDNSEFLETITEYEDQVVYVIDPKYKDYILPIAARRMAKGIKMGIVASKIALEEAGLNAVDAVITGTGMGCLLDSEKFLKAVNDNNEQYLTPTSFIQSTHNTVGGQIALDLKCKGYNFTYVHGSISFESALLDAKLQLEQGEERNILIGGIDELADYTLSIHKLVNHVKSEKVKTLGLLNSISQGAVFGEGANFFVLSNEKQESTYAEVVAVKTYNTLPKSELIDTACDFLNELNLSVNAIDVLILGYNGDVDFDDYYQEFQSDIFKNTQQLYYKHLCGEFNTASSFGLWLGSKILKTQHIPDVVKINKTSKSTFKYILLYNQYRGENHSFTVLKQC